MGTLTQTLDEYNYYVNNIRESFQLIGQEAILYQVSVSDRDLYYDTQNKYREGTKISLIFDSNPKPLLKKFNWLTEGEDIPYVANICALADDGSAIEIQEEMKIVLISKFGLKTDRLFKVSRVHANNIDPLVYICKLVPYRFHVDVDTEKPGYQKDLVEGKDEERGTKYIKGDFV